MMDQVLFLSGIFYHWKKNKIKESEFVIWKECTIMTDFRSDMFQPIDRQLCPFHSVPIPIIHCTWSIIHRPACWTCTIHLGAAWYSVLALIVYANVIELLYWQPRTLVECLCLDWPLMDAVCVRLNERCSSPSHDLFSFVFWKRSLAT